MSSTMIYVLMGVAAALTLASVIGSVLTLKLVRSRRVVNEMLAIQAIALSDPENIDKFIAGLQALKSVNEPVSEIGKPNRETAAGIGSR